MYKPVFEIGFKVVTLISLVAVLVLLMKKDDSIVYVDAAKLISGYKGMALARKEYETKTAVWSRNIDSLKSELQLRISDYQQKANKMSANEKALAENLLQAKEDQLTSYQQTIGEKLQQADHELTGKVLQRVNEYVKKYGEANGYAIIMAATQYGNIVYAQEGRDITDEVLSGLNSEFSN